MYKYVCCVCICFVYTCVFVYMYVRVCICVLMYICMHLCVRYMAGWIYVCMCMHVCVYIYMLCVHMCMETYILTSVLGDYIFHPHYCNFDSSGDYLTLSKRQDHLSRCPFEAKPMVQFQRAVGLMCTWVGSGTEYSQGSSQYSIALESISRCPETGSPDILARQERRFTQTQTALSPQHF